MEKDYVYIAQYLPVKGKLRKGQRCIANREGLTDMICQYLGGDTFKSLTLTPVQDIVLPNWQERFDFIPHELFLCDRDLKPLGVVSPEAIWVTEEMEFEYAEVKSGWVDISTRKILGNHWGKAIAKNNPDVLNAFQILCPTCKNFH